MGVLHLKSLHQDAKCKQQLVGYPKLWGVGVMSSESALLIDWALVDTLEILLTVLLGALQAKNPVFGAEWQIGRMAEWQNWQNPILPLELESADWQNMQYTVAVHDVQSIWYNYSTYDGVVVHSAVQFQYIWYMVPWVFLQWKQV
jgi:hypothetical protein